MDDGDNGVGANKNYLYLKNIYTTVERKSFLYVKWTFRIFVVG